MPQPRQPDAARKKAGGLNQALDLLLPTLRDEDGILVIDADSILDKETDWRIDSSPASLAALRALVAEPRYA